MSRPVGEVRTTTAPLALGSLLVVVRGVVLVVLRTLGAHQVIEAGGHLALPLLVEMTQRGPGRLRVRALRVSPRSRP